MCPRFNGSERRTRRSITSAAGGAQNGSCRRIPHAGTPLMIFSLIHLFIKNFFLFKKYLHNFLFAVSVWYENDSICCQVCALVVFFSVPVECVIGQDDAEFNQNDANVEKEGRNSEKTCPFSQQNGGAFEIEISD